MRTMLLAVGTVIAMSSAASAADHVFLSQKRSDVICSGSFYEMQSWISVYEDADKGTECRLPWATRAAVQLKHYCDKDGYCDFHAHVIHHLGDIYTVDRITGGIREGD